MSITRSPLLRLTAVCAVLVVVAYFAAGSGGNGSGPARSGDPADEASEPSPFGAVPATGPGVVAVGGGVVLPITGGTEGAWRVLTPCGRPAVVDGERLSGAHVVVDPGHGGRETGAVGPGGLAEAALNLDVAGRVTERLEEAGATVVLTRRSDMRVTLATRAAIADALDPLLFVSIHHNGGPTRPSSEPGVQVFHQKDAPEAARLAGLLWEELRAGLRPFSDEWSAGRSTGVRSRIGTDGEDYYGVLRDVEGVPAVLIEALYLSGEPEAELLAEAAVRDAEAEAITAGILAWLETDRRGSGFLAPLTAQETAGGGGGTEGCLDPPGLGGS